MGWLREYMAASEPPVQSFGKLASACLEHPGWPEDLQPKERSLATLFSKLDRQKDLDWLRDRVEVQRVLANLLKRPLADIRLTLGERPSEEHPRFVRLIDVRFAREIDLGKEPLPPGIPADLLSPPNWNTSWWLAPSGSGRSLVGAWLRARGLAHVAFVRTREDLFRVPKRGPVFIEVDASAQPETLRFEQSELDFLRWGERPLCIAAPFAAPSCKFESFSSPEPEKYLPELIDWLFARLDESGHFRADRAENWMLKVAIPAGAVKTLGDALGLLGMLDEIHPRSLLAKSLDEVGEHFVRRRLREGAEELNQSPRLVDTAYGILKECAARVLVGGKNELLAPHSIDEWTALLARPDDDDAPEPEWFHRALRGSLGAQISRRDLERAAKKLPPNSFQLTRHLEAASLLVPSRHPDAPAETHRSLHPRWLVSLLTARATQEVLRLSPAQWGQVFLGARRADDMILSLLRRAESDDFSPFFALLDDFDPKEPELIAAAEGAIIVAGFCLLEGHEVPEELLEGLAHIATDDFVVVHGLPEPRLTSENSQFFRRSHYLTALFALSAQVRFPIRALDPFSSEKPDLLVHFREAAAWSLLHSTPGSARAVGILKLLDGLFDSAHPLRPAVLRIVSDGPTAPNELFRAALEECPIETLLAYVASTGQHQAAFIQRLWAMVQTRDDIAELFQSREALRDFWRKAPTSALKGRVETKKRIDWSALLPHQFSDLLDVDLELDGEAGLHFPLEPVLSRIEKKGATSIPKSALSGVIMRGPARFVPPLLRLLATGNTLEARHILLSAPPETRPRLAEALPGAAELLKFKNESIQEIRDFLLTSCRARDPDFETCYDVLTKLERGLSPLKRLL